MSKGIMVLNAGSSSIKFAVFVLGASGTEPAPVLRGQIAGIGSAPQFKAADTSGNPLSDGSELAGAHIGNHQDALGWLLDWINGQSGHIELQGVGHRVVHGGRARTRPEPVTQRVMDELDLLSPLAPHHQPHNVAAIRALAARAPDLLQVACFDTAFHANQPEATRRLPLPARYAERGIIRYGFHGLSYEYITGALPGYMDGERPSRVVVAHLGNGASLAAVRDGVGVATTMGFSTLDGLMMGTRCGALDPGVLLHLMHEDGLGEEELTELLYNQCGLLGVSGISSDMQVLLASEDARAAGAVELFCATLVQALGSMMAVLEGMDALVFTGGIGEHAASVRETVCRRLGWAGVELDEAANERNGPRISAPGSRTTVWVVPTNEELVIARHTARVLERG